METCCYIFLDNVQLCKTITEKHVQHFIHLIELHGRKVQYIKFLQTIIKAENQYIKNCQDIVMSEVSTDPSAPHNNSCVVLFTSVGYLGRSTDFLREGKSSRSGRAHAVRIGTSRSELAVELSHPTGASPGDVYRGKERVHRNQVSLVDRAR